MKCSSNQGTMHKSWPKTTCVYLCKKFKYNDFISWLNVFESELTVYAKLARPAGHVQQILEISGEEL